MKIVVALLFVAGFYCCLSFDAQGQVAVRYQYISPRPDAQYVSAGTTIAVRHGAPIHSQSVSADLFYVVGSVSGVHTGKVIVADDQKTVIFVADQPFAPGETVNVTVDAGITTVSGAILERISYKFTTSLGGPAQGNLDPLWPAADEPRRESDRSSVERSSVETTARTASHYVTVPSDFPTIEAMDGNGEDAGDGYIFLGANQLLRAPGSGRSAPYLLILDDAGEPVFYRRMTKSDRIFDFKKQPNGLLTYFDTTDRVFYSLDNTYTQVDTYLPGNGYEEQADGHELLFLPNGNYLILAQDYQQIDMSKVVPDGKSDATVIGIIIQELDADRNVVFEWRSWDHFELTDCTYPMDGQVVSPVHVNSIDVDDNGDVLISSRNLDEVTKISRKTGGIIWRFGGNNNQFTLMNDTQFFRGQHDARWLPNGNISIFDNRLDLSPEYSRAVEYSLNEVNRTAHLIWEYRNSPDIYSAFLSNAQRLPNGNTVIGWGVEKPSVTEVREDGVKVMELTLHDAYSSYRAFRFPWTGNPPWPPTLTYQIEAGETSLYYSWNGATDVVSYLVYAGSTPDSMELIEIAQRDGFENSTNITDLLDEYAYYQIIPVNKMNERLTASSVIQIYENPVYLPSLSATN